MLPLVSVIVPVYNTEKYVKKCILSILNQTYKNIELIVVNDGSTDKSIEVADNLLRNNLNSIIINQKNKGLSEARNEGIKVATGKYIFLLDSDDYIDSNVITTMVKKSEKEDLDVVIGKYNVVYKNNIIKPSIENLQENIILNNLEALKELFVSGKFHFHT